MQLLAGGSPIDDVPKFTDIESDQDEIWRLQLEWMRARLRERDNSQAPPEHMLPEPTSASDHNSASDSDGDTSVTGRKRRRPSEEDMIITIPAVPLLD